MEKPSILIVDDTPDNLSIISKLLREDYRIRVANSGENAIRIARAEDPPELILLDIMMPDMDGYEVCKALKADLKTRSIPVIFLTALKQQEDEVKGFEAGAGDFLTKPVNPFVAKARIDAQLTAANNAAQLRRQVIEKTFEINSIQLEIIKRLSRASEYRDIETGFHIERMSSYSYWLSVCYGIDEEEALLIKHAAPMHDLGKIGVPEEVLMKKGPLNKEEWKLIARHPQIGAEIIGESKSKLLTIAKSMALEHHEKWDGTGYPFGLKGKEISIYARIVAVADVYDALLSNRPYKKAWNQEDTIAYIISESGKHFDPEIVQAFTHCLDKLHEVLKTYSN